MQRTIGILLDPRVLAGLPKNRTGTEKIKFYQRAAKSLGLTVVYTSLYRIHFQKRKVSGYLYSKGRWKRKTVPLPRVFHNRAMPFDSVGRRHLRKLCAATKVFNQKTRYNKLQIHRLLANDRTTRPYVPETVKYSRHNLEKMMNKYRDIFVKPVSGSIGQGILNLSKTTDHRWEFRKEGKKRTITSATIAKKRVAKIVGAKPYLIQEGVALARFKNKPFDLRVTVQRGGNGRWNVTGIVGKVAARGKRITNLARGGKAVRAEQLYRALGWNEFFVHPRVNEASLAAARILSKHLKGLGDIGFDIGLSRDGKPFIIEMNGRDQRYSFRKAGMKDTFYQTYATPVAYAAYLLKT